VADTALDGADVAGLALRAASVRGLSHRYDATPRQDAFALGATADQRAVALAVADGVSAAPRAELGARLVAERGVEVALELLEGGATAHSIDAKAVMAEVASRSLADAARSLGTEHDEATAALVASTLVLAVAMTEPCDGYHAFFVASVGNSEAFVLSELEWATVALRRRGSVADNRTDSLPLQPERARGRSLEVRSGTALFLVSDGVTEALGDGRGEVGDYLARHWAEAPDPLELARALQFRRRGCTDDRTVVGIWLP
jgi:serine/threonine protein phosphatase PrpC